MKKLIKTLAVILPLTLSPLAMGQVNNHLPSFQTQRTLPSFVYRGQEERALLEQGYTISGGVDKNHPATKARLAKAKQAREEAQQAREQYEVLQITKQKQTQAFMFKSIFDKRILVGASAEGLNKALRENPYVKESLASVGITGFESVNIRDKNQYNQIAQTFGEENAEAALKSPQRIINGQFIGIRDENGQLQIWSTETLGALIGKIKEEMDALYNLNMLRTINER